MKYSYILQGRGSPIPFSARITDVIIKAGIAQYTFWFDWHRTPITFLPGFYQILIFSPLIQKTLQHCGMIWRVLVQKDWLCSQWKERWHPVKTD